MSRKLASIQKIIDIKPIEGADKIELAQILGWSVIVKKNEFKVGDLVVYCEVDSLMPEKPEFEFLRSKKFRIRAMKMRGVYSYGICFPLSIIPVTTKPIIDDDVTDIIGVRKYDPEAEKEALLLAKKAELEKSRLKKYLMRNSLYRKLYFLFKKDKRNSWPQFISKTDEIRVQGIPQLFETERDKGTIFEVGEKLDGQSSTYFVVKNPNIIKRFWKPYLFGVCSRNFQLAVPDNSTYWKAAKKYDIEEKLIRYAKEYKANTIVLQGEILDPKVQGNKYKVKETEFYAFNFIVDGEKYNSLSIKNWCKNNQIPHVPIISTEFKLPNTINELLEMAKGKSEINKDTIREGIVLRNYEKNISFKCINPDFLLKYQDEDEANQIAYKKGKL